MVFILVIWALILATISLKSPLWMFFFSLVDHPHPIRHEIWQEKRNFPFPSLLYYSQLKALFTPNWQLEDGSIAPLKMTKKCSKGCAVCVYNVSDFELYYSRKKKIGFDLCLNDEIKHMDLIVSNFTQCLKIITYLLLKICLCLGIFERQKKINIGVL